MLNYIYLLSKFSRVKSQNKWKFIPIDNGNIKYHLEQSDISLYIRMTFYSVNVLFVWG